MNGKKKINKIQVLIIYVAFSVGLFFLLRKLIVRFFISDDADPLKEMSQATSILPYFIGFYATLLVAISFTGWRIAKKYDYVHLVSGFVYSLVYSLVLFLGFIIFLIYYLLQ